MSPPQIMKKWGFSTILAVLFAKALHAGPPRLILQPSSGATGINGFFTLAALYDPDGNGPAGMVNVSSHAAFAVADPALLTFNRTAATGQTIFGGRAAGSTVVTATYGGLSVDAAVTVSGDVHSRSFITADGRTRSYRFYSPAGLSGPVPLLLSLHGGGGQGSDQELLTNMDVLASERQFVVVYPDGVLDAGGGHWNDGRGLAAYEAQAQNVDDVGFLAEVVSRVSQEVTIDPRRLYVSGFSNGSLMAKRFACERSDLVAAVGTGGSTLPNAILSDCRFSHPMPWFHFHGTEDGHAPITGGDLAGGETMSLYDLRTIWASKNGCSGLPSVQYLADTFDDGTRVRREESLCPAGANVALYFVEGAGHTWPGGVQYLEEQNVLPVLAVGKTGRDHPASPMMWDFLSRFLLPSTGAPAPSPRGYPNPWMASSGAPGITIDRVPAGSTVRVYTSAGRLVRRLEAAESGVVLWDLRTGEGDPAGSGVYLIAVSGVDRRFKVVVQR